jgi:hypothetical protein
MQQSGGKWIISDTGANTFGMKVAAGHLLGKLYSDSEPIYITEPGLRKLEPPSKSTED